MPKKKTPSRPSPSITPDSITPEEMARAVVSEYLRVHTLNVPTDAIPDEVGWCFYDKLWILQDACMAADSEKLDGFEEGALIRASYLLGFEMGRHLGGVR